MLSYWRNPTYNNTSPILRFPDFNTLLFVDIPMTLTSYTVASANFQVGSRTGIPYIINQQNNTLGSFTPMVSGMELPKLTMGGFMDTPSTTSGRTRVSTFTYGGFPGSYADYIAANWEGRNLGGRANHPTYFRDPYGRITDNPRITAFEANWVEGIPFRQEFTMTLQITRSYDL